MRIADLLPYRHVARSPSLPPSLLAKPRSLASYDDDALTRVSVVLAQYTAKEADLVYANDPQLVQIHRSDEVINAGAQPTRDAILL